MLGSSGLGETRVTPRIQNVAWVKRSRTQGSTTCPQKEKPLTGRGFPIAVVSRIPLRCIRATLAIKETPPGGGVSWQAAS